MLYGRPNTVKLTTRHQREEFTDARHNASIILKFSNVTPFKYLRNMFGCLYCPYTSPDFGPVKDHINEHKDIDRAQALRNVEFSSICKVDATDLRCEICQKNMKDISTLFEHLIEAHEKPLIKEFNFGVVPYLLNDGFSCADCDASFSVFWNLNSHMNKHYLNFICPDCGQGFVNNTRLKSHIKNVHNKPTSINCSKCDECFPTPSAKRVHMFAKHNICAYKCPYCTDSFKLFHERLKHLNEHHDKNINYSCSFCSKVFTTASDRTCHEKSFHIKEKIYVCAVCGKEFTNPGYLKEHENSHSAVKVHKCDICKKSYGRKHTLTLHMRIHDDDRRFVCLLCGKGFVQKCSLKGHLRTQHPEAANDEITYYIAS